MRHASRMSGHRTATRSRIKFKCQGEGDAKGNARRLRHAAAIFSRRDASNTSVRLGTTVFKLI